MRMKHQKNRHQRYAVTLVEVIFAIGVVLVGLLGLLSVLTLAGQRASDSISTSIASSYAASVMNELEARQYLSGDNLVQIRPSTETASNNITFTFNPSNFPSGVTVDMSVANPSSFCIDPLFSSETTLPAATSPNGYSVDVFPYYYADHNPLLDPLTDVSRNWPVGSLPIPRMPRVGISVSGYIFRAPPAPNPLPPPFVRPYLSAEQSRRLVENVDDLVQEKTEDAAILRGQQATTDGIAYGKRLPSGDFTWIATVNPLPDSEYASVAVVVMNKRSREPFNADGDSFSAPVSVGGAADVSDNASSERLAYVTYAAGFSGGAGGVVHLVSSSKTSPKIRPNSWIMLSRFLPSGNQIHRWYRVAAVQGDPEEIEYEDSSLPPLPALPTGSPDVFVWRNTLLLDGSDWSFNYPSGVAPFPPPTLGNTYATILSDVVSVTERVVLLRSL